MCSQPQTFYCLIRMLPQFLCFYFSFFLNYRLKLLKFFFLVIFFSSPMVFLILSPILYIMFFSHFLFYRNLINLSISSDDAPPSLTKKFECFFDILASSKRSESRNLSFLLIPTPFYFLDFLKVLLYKFLFDLVEAFFFSFNKFIYFFVN